MTGSEDGTLRIWNTRSVWELVLRSFASSEDADLAHLLLPNRTSQIQRNYDHKSPVNDVVIHPNQGELVSCDQDGSVKIWDLADNICTHELVRLEPRL